MKRIFFLLFLYSKVLLAQEFYFGNDLSYANMMEDCGAIFKDHGQSKDVYKIFADRGCNLVRFRLWYEPTWQNTLSQPEGVKVQYNDFEDVKEGIHRAKDAGMQVMLGFQFSDFWADPGRQVVPAKWAPIAWDLEVLKDSVYNYVFRTLTALEDEDILPELVKVGNETNIGMMTHASMSSDFSPEDLISYDWSRQAELYNAAISAIRDMSALTKIKPKIALHFSGLNNLKWWYGNIISHGVTDFDIMGFSYYYAWHGNGINTLGERITQLKADYPGYDAMVVETGYLWSTQNFDNLGNIIAVPDPQYLPVSPEKQLEYMVDYTKEVMKSGGIGVIFWEPAWVSTPCRTPWGQGSSQEHVAFFDSENTNFMENGGGRWTEPMFYENINDVTVIFKVDMTDKDVSNGVYITGHNTNWVIEPMSTKGDNIYEWSGKFTEGDTMAYYYLTTGNWDNYLDYRESVPQECALMWGSDRQIIIPKNDSTVFVTWGSCISTGTGMHDQDLFEMERNIHIFPNPSKGIFHVELNSLERVVSMDLIDITGKMLRSYKMQHDQKLVDIDLTNLSSNFYILRVNYPNKAIHKKLMLNTYH